MANETDTWLKRGKEVLAKGAPGQVQELIPFAVSILSALYGSRSPQLESFNARMKEVTQSSKGSTEASWGQSVCAYYTVANVIGEIEDGLIVNLRAQVAGEVMSELIALGKEILAGETDAAKNVSAVLIAAAYEDLMRRLGSQFAGVVGRPKLEDVVGALKNAGILKGSEVGIALSYLQFRNDSLHADWPRIQKSQVQSCIGFIEPLLVKHFS